MASGDNKQSLAEVLRAGGYEDDESHNLPYSQNLAMTSKEVQRRVRALKKYQLECIAVESQFYQSVHELEKQFQPKFNAINNKRKAVVTGEHQPTDEECSNVPLVHGIADEDLQKLENDAPNEGMPSVGVPNFWFHVLNNTEAIREKIEEYDEPILKYLVDISAEVHSDPKGFSLLFAFAKNPYFTNDVLKKDYVLDFSPDVDVPFAYEGSTVTKGQGTVINWHEGKNVTQKVVKRKQKKGSGIGRFTTKTVPSDSFFNFFDPSPKVFSTDIDPDLQDDYQDDFELGTFIRDHLIPRAVLFYTGEEGVEHGMGGYSSSSDADGESDSADDDQDDVDAE